jgi:hypothetical protein
MQRTPTAIIEATTELLKGRDWNNGSIPIAVSHVVYPAMADGFTGVADVLRAHGVPEKVIRKAMFPIAELVDHLTHPDTVSALVAAWGTTRRRPRWRTAYEQGRRDALEEILQMADEGGAE